MKYYVCSSAAQLLGINAIFADEARLDVSQIKSCMSGLNISVSPMDQPEQDERAAAAQGIARENLQDSSSNLAAVTAQQTSGALAQLTACYREISDDDDASDDAERY